MLGAHAEAPAHHAATTVDGLRPVRAGGKLPARLEWPSRSGRRRQALDLRTARDQAPDACRAGGLLVQPPEAGIFHADPHPGNLFRKDDGQLAILDLIGGARMELSL